MGKLFPAGNLTEMLVDGVLDAEMDPVFVEFALQRKSARILRPLLALRRTVTLRNLLPRFSDLDPDTQTDLVMSACNELLRMDSGLDEDDEMLQEGEERVMEPEELHLIEFFRKKIALLSGHSVVIADVFRQLTHEKIG